MNTIEEVLALEDISKKISYLKKGRRTPLPNTVENLKDWDIRGHDVFDKDKRKDNTIVTAEEKKIFDDKTGKTRVEPAKKEPELVNRIGIPLEQDIVNIQTAFTVGIEPTLDCTPNDDGENNLLSALKAVFQYCKLKFQNKKIVRSWLSEQEVAEYWYVVVDDSFWSKVWRKIKYTFTGKNGPTAKLKSVLWSPFRGDKLYPFFDESGDMVAFSREYKRKDLDDKEIECFMVITKDSILHYELDTQWELKTEKSFKHNLPKLPVIYSYRREPYCKKIKTFRERLETLLSNYADCIDYHFFPLLKLIGDVDGISGKRKDRMVKLTGQGADAQYLTWDQVPDTVKFEAETLTDMAYSMTGTPRISFKDLQGTGNTLSGVSFRYAFMGAHMAVSNHAEDLGEFFQRRVNFLVAALGAINSGFYKSSQTIDINTEIVPFMIDNIDDKVNTAVTAVEGGIWSTREGIVFAGNADRLESELKEIKEEQNEKVQNKSNSGGEQVNPKNKA